MHQVDGDPETQLAADWALFHGADTGVAPAGWRVWESSERVVVIGRRPSSVDEVDLAACAADGVRIIRRFSGGGAVVLGAGCLNYAVALPFESRPALIDVERSFQFILGSFAAALAIPGLAIAGSADLALDGRKVSGNAQRRGRRVLLQHGTLLYDFDARLAARYLKAPARQPDYRARRCHVDFLGNLPLAGPVVRATVEAACAALCPAATQA
jgi:lipoate---protein ligase